MGRAKEIMMENQYNDEILGLLKQLVEREEITGAGAGISMRALDKGLNSLSVKQRDVIEKIVSDYKAKHVCKRCDNGNLSSLTDLIDVADDGMCPMCKADEEKYFRE